MARSWKLKQPRKPSPPWQCPICDKVISPRGKRGHLKLAHQIAEMEDIEAYLVDKKVKALESRLEIFMDAGKEIYIDIVQRGLPDSPEFEHFHQLPLKDEYVFGRFRLIRFQETTMYRIRLIEYWD